MRPAAQACHEIWFQKASNIQEYPWIYHAYTMYIHQMIYHVYPLKYHVFTVWICMIYPWIKYHVYPLLWIYMVYPWIYHEYTMHIPCICRTSTYTWYIPCTCMICTKIGIPDWYIPVSMHYVPSTYCVHTGMYCVYNDDWNIAGDAVLCCMPVGNDTVCTWQWHVCCGATTLNQCTYWCPQWHTWHYSGTYSVCTYLY